MTIDWNQAEEVVAPVGAFIGWAAAPGQVVIGKVLIYDPNGGVDFNGGACPQISLELIEAAQSFNKQGQVTTLAAGELCNITCGAVNLKANIRAADPKPGDLIRIELTEIVNVTKGTVKKFKVHIIHGAGGPVSTPTAQPQQQVAAQPQQQVAAQPQQQVAAQPQQQTAAQPQQQPVAQTQPAAQAAPQTTVTDPAPANFDQATWDGFDEKTKESIRRMQGA
ncbi:hypothetical protein [Gordonia sp. N1V]|uniref:hypothetical protein n=1 Tax=Gordonia sp. N1V TaxID=3034163 RepID=UPI0023E0FB40|nr:hypothetical protein [Gordonia sp. N1V]MDF3280864.1 hypothetical protein [Gordonia sp. N1V]